MLKKQENELRIRKGLLYVQDRFEDLVMGGSDSREEIIEDIQRVLNELKEELRDKEILERGDDLEGPNYF